MFVKFGFNLLDKMLSCIAY